MQKMILPFDVDEITLDQAGGKGLNLSKTARGDFPVPPGFIVTTEAYRFFAQTNQTDAGIEGLYRALSIDDPASVETTSQAIRQLFEAGQMPVDIQNSILKAYRLPGQISQHLRLEMLETRILTFSENAAAKGCSNQTNVQIMVSPDW